MLCEPRSLVSGSIRVHDERIYFAKFQDNNSYVVQYSPTMTSKAKQLPTLLPLENEQILSFSVGEKLVVLTVDKMVFNYAFDRL